MGENEKVATAGTVTTEKTFTEKFHGGTNVHLTMELKATNWNQEDLETVLSFIAVSARQFYLETPQKINNKP